MAGALSPEAARLRLTAATGANSTMARASAMMASTIAVPYPVSENPMSVPLSLTLRDDGVMRRRAIQWR
jgi:hypothetical protein